MRLPPARQRAPMRSAAAPRVLISSERGSGGRSFTAPPGKIADALRLATRLRRGATE
jgi:hypothetical protein